MNFSYRNLIVVFLAFSACTASQTASNVGRVTVGRPSNNSEGRRAADEQVSPRARALFEDATKAAETQRKNNVFDFPALERKYRAAADADSRFAEPQFNLGVLAERQGKTKEAIAHYREALNRNPALRQASVNLAVLAQNSGDLETAVRVLEEVQENFPDDASSRAHLAEIHRQRGEPERALEMSREALFRDPKTLTAYKVMVRAYLDQKQLSMARLVGLRALVLDDGDAELHYCLGLVAQAEKDTVRARASFKKAVSLKPDFVPAHVELAQMAFEQEDYAGAEESLRRILQNKGKNAETLLNLGVAYKGMGQYDKALQAYQEAQNLNPDLPSVYLNRGIIVAAKGDFEGAKTLYQQYLSLSGGEVAVSAEHAVFQLIRDADAAIEKREQDKRAIEEAKRMEEEARLAEEAAKEEARKQKEAEFQRQKEEAKGKVDASAAGRKKSDIKEESPGASVRKSDMKVGSEGQKSKKTKKTTKPEREEIAEPDL